MLAHFFGSLMSGLAKKCSVFVVIKNTGIPSPSNEQMAAKKVEQCFFVFSSCLQTCYQLCTKGILLKVENALNSAPSEYSMRICPK